LDNAARKERTMSERYEDILGAVQALARAMVEKRQGERTDLQEGDTSGQKVQKSDTTAAAIGGAK
jgi:hypothetical protein